MSDEQILGTETKGNLNDNEMLAKDTTYSPSSDAETAIRQEDQSTTATADSEVDDKAVKVLPGTGGPDDVGDIEVDPKDLNMPGTPRKG